MIVLRRLRATHTVPSRRHNSDDRGIIAISDINSATQKSRVAPRADKELPIPNPRKAGSLDAGRANSLCFPPAESGQLGLTAHQYLPRNQGVAELTRNRRYCGTMNNMRLCFILFLMFSCALPSSAQVLNLLTSPNDLTNDAWQNGDTRCTKTSVQVYTSTGHLCSLWQELSVSANTSYSITMVLAITAGTNQAVTLNLYTDTYSVLCSQTVVLSSTPQVLSCIGSSGANTNVLMELDTGEEVSSTISVVNSAMYLYQVWSMGYYTPFPGNANPYAYPSLTDIDWAALTHVIMVGGQPLSTGVVELPPTIFASAATTLISNAHAHSVKVLFDLADLGYGGSDFADAINNNEPTLITNIMTTVNTYGFDGVHVDDEEPWNASLMTTFLSDLRTNLGTRLLTFNAQNSTSSDWDAAHAAYMDRVLFRLMLNMARDHGIRQ